MRLSPCIVGLVVLLVSVILFADWSGALLTCRRLHGFYRRVLEGRAQRLHRQFRATCRAASVPYRRVLDFGCGFGGLSDVLRRRKAAVTSVDVVDHYIYTERDHLRLVDKEAASLPFGAAEFDVAVSSYCFHHIPIKHHARLLRELTRVAGVVVLLEEHPKRNLLCRFLNSEVFTHANAHMTLAQWKRHISAMGFTNVGALELNDYEFGLVLR